MFHGNEYKFPNMQPAVYASVLDRKQVREFSFASTTHSVTMIVSGISVVSRAISNPCYT